MRILAIAVVILCAVTITAGQDATRHEFEVASVRPAGLPRSVVEFLAGDPPGQWRLRGVSLFGLIMVSYPEFRLPGLVVGGPGWIRDTKFDLDARMNPATTRAQLQAMIRRLLNDRFALRTHVEERILDVFVLTQASPGKLGPGMTPSAPACVTWRLKGGKVPVECDVRRRVGASGGGITLSVATVSDLITFFSLGGPPSSPTMIDRPIIDRTGLDGYFDMVGPSPLASGQSGTLTGADGSFFTLLREQLGLKVTRTREMVDVLVVDSASLPQPN